MLSNHNNGGIYEKEGIFFNFGVIPFVYNYIIYHFTASVNNCAEYSHSIKYFQHIAYIKLLLFNRKANKCIHIVIHIYYSTTKIEVLTLVLFYINAGNCECKIFVCI